MIKTVVWLTRHTPPEDAVKHFRAQGYRSVSLVDWVNKFGSADAFTFNSGKQAVELACRVAQDLAGAVPDAIVAVMPPQMLAEVLRATDVPILKVEMAAVAREEGKTSYEWTGKIERIVEVKVVTEEWSP